MTIYDVAVIPLIVGIVELFKQIGLPQIFLLWYLYTWSRYRNCIYISKRHKRYTDGPGPGLGSIGLYSGTKSTVEGIGGIC